MPVTPRTCRRACPEPAEGMFKMAKLPLEGIRVLDSTYVIGLPYAGALLADMGAEVIKIEGPGRPDPTRTGGFHGSFPENEVRDDWWNRASIYNLLNRGKRSLTLDLTDSRARDVFRELVAISDVVLENFTQRVMAGWGLDYPSLKKTRPDIIMLSNTGYGHGDGPYSDYPAQGTALEGTHGLCWITGYPDGPPSRAGASYVDFVATWTCLFAVGAALRYRNRTGRGQWVDLAMYQAGAMFTSEYLMDYQVNGRLGKRIGNRHPYRAPQGCYRAAGTDQWAVLSVGDDEQWRALCRLMVRPGLADDPRFDNLPGRLTNHNQLDIIINQWTEKYDKYILMEMLQSEGIPASPVLSGKDTHADPHLRARGFLEKVTYPRERGIGTRPLIGRPYKFSRTHLGIQGPAPALGEHNRAVLVELLGMAAGEYQALERDGTIAAAPAAGEPVFPTPIAQQVEKRLLAGWDPDYKKRLGIS